MRRFLTLFTVLMFSVLLTFAQSRVVTGVVTDDKGAPVEGATIRVKGAKTGTAADANGSYRISVPAGATLVISGVGIAPQEIAVGNQSTVNVSVSRNVGVEATVVVTAAGIRRSEKSLGYTVSKVDPTILVQQSEPDVLKTLQGKVSGVDIRTSQGTPGAATRIQIRGNSSFFGDNQPLIIVDGVPYSNTQLTTSSQTTGGGAYGSGISDLDPNDIASMSILKGSSAGALYGSRASNGVIIITTKSGSATRSKKGMEVNFKSSVSFENIANLPEYQNLFGTGANFDYSNSNGSWGPAFGQGRTWAGTGAWSTNTSGTDSIPAWPEFKAAYPSLFPSANIAFVPQPNNVKNLFTTGVVFENSIGFNGGDEKTAFSLVGSQLNQKGYVPNSSYDRSNLSMGGSTKLNIGLNLRGNVGYSRSTQKGGFFGEQQFTGASSEFARTLFLGRNWNTDLPFETLDGKSITWNGGAQFDNPKWASKYNRITTFEERTNANMHADFNLTKWAKVDYGIGSNVVTINRRQIIEIGSRAAQGTGSITLDNLRQQEIESTFLLSLTPTITKDFTVNARVGTSFNQRTTLRQANTGNTFIVRGIYNLSNTSQQIFNADTYSRRRLLGVLGDLTLGYKNWAFLTATGRNDWSSTLPQANRSYFYPSLSGSLVFTDALKISNSILDYGKVRASWAKVGRDANPYSLDDVFNLGTNFLGQTTASLPGTANNPQLQPEFTKETEFGTQLSFLKRRIEVDFTVYNKISTNQIAAIAVPTSTGYFNQVRNFGQISNKGIEVELTLRPIRSKNFNWDIRTVYTQNKNTVDKLIDGVDRIALGGVGDDPVNYLEAGQPFGYLRGSMSARDSATGALLINPLTGFLIRSVNQGYIGNPSPRFKMGVTNTFTYKGFSLSALFDWTSGGDMYSVTNSSLLGRGVIAFTADRLSSWVLPGIYGDANTQKAILIGGKTVPNQTRISTNDLYFGESFAINAAREWNVFDATVYRLRELSLGYDVPKSVFKKLPIGSLSVSVTGRNLWFYAPGFAKSTNFDPEVNSYGSTSVQGLELSAAPTSKRIGINLNVTF